MRIDKISSVSMLIIALAACGGSQETQNIQPTAPQNIQPIAPTPLPANGMQAEDLAEDIPQSNAIDINVPRGLDAFLNIEYLGAFRAIAGGEPEGNSSNYAVGTLGYNKTNDSLYLAGHSQYNGIAEFKVPDNLGFDLDVSGLPIAPVLQNYTNILSRKNEGQDTNRITGILYFNSNLIVTSEIWYDAPGTNEDNLQLFRNPYDLQNSSFEGMLQLEGKAKAAGYMSEIPLELQSDFGSEYLVGWASNYSITSRYSQGPSLYTFDPQDVVDAVPSIDRSINTQVKQVYDLAQGSELVDGGATYNSSQSPVWGSLARAIYGFVIPNSRIFMVVGSHGGIHSGVGYKITQDDGNVCEGPCSYEVADNYNYFWLYNIDDILSAEEPFLPRPFSYGKWSHPYDQSGSKQVIGATYDLENKRLFLSISEAGQVGIFDRPPVIIGYKIEAKIL